MIKSKIIDCITFFDNNLMFDIRYNILSSHVDYFVICESKYDHKGNPKKKTLFGKENMTVKKLSIYF